MSYSGFKTIGVVGAGAWGTALAQTAAKTGHEVKIWAFEPELVDGINNNSENHLYLPEVTLEESIAATNDLETVLTSSDLILSTTPAQHLGSVYQDAADKIPHNVPILICSKGIEIKTGRLLSQVFQGLCPNAIIGALSGPSFAREVAEGAPTAVTIAVSEQHRETGYQICEALSHLTFRPYLNHDIIGVQVGGALKNVIAIACGISNGRQMGDNARAAIITRGLAEIVRFGVAIGAEEETFLGLSGIGDLTLTCNAMQSRNFSLGVEIGRGQDAKSVENSRNSVTEGVYTAKAVVALAEKLNIEMPITHAVYEAVSGQKAIEQVIRGLLERPVTTE